MKNTIKHLLQKALGYEHYLFVFAKLTIWKLRSGGHEKEFNYFLDLIPNEGTILDIGANIGAMTAVLAMKRPGASVCAFEPVPENAGALRRVIKHYRLKNVTVYETALGNENGTLNMVRPVISNVKMQGLSHVLKEHDDSEWNRGDTFSVPVQRLDDIEAVRQIPKIHAIKIDVENFEYYVFLGSMNLIRRHKPVIYCELWSNEMRTSCLTILKDLGYSVKVYDGRDLCDYTDQQVTNFIFIPS